VARPVVTMTDAGSGNKMASRRAIVDALFDELERLNRLER
jgi:hypothetical protein